jgi:hypothetical protein
MHAGSLSYRLLGVLVVGVSCSIIACSGGGGGGQASTAPSAALAAPVISAPGALAAGEGGTASVSGQSGVTYTWSISGGSISGSNQGPSVSFRAGSDDPLFLTVTASDGSSTVSAQFKVKVQTQPPSLPAISAPTSVPTNATGLTASITPESGVSYAWSIQDGVITSGTSGATVTFNAGAAGTLTLTCAATNRVGTSTGQAFVQVQAGAPAVPTITAPATATVGATGLTASVAAQSGVTYQWTVQNGTLTGGQGTNAITFSAPTAGTLQLGCTVTNASALSSSAQASVSVASTSTMVLGSYGSALGLDSLANTRIGGPYGTTAAFRFRAGHSGTLAAIKVYFIWDTSAADAGGYSGGTGGTMVCSLMADDGSASHFPKPPALAVASLPSPIGKKFPVVPFASPVSIQAGTLYHIVFTNGDPSPSVNYASVNCVYAKVALNPRQPAYADTDWAMLLNGSPDGGTTVGTSWSLRGASTGDSYCPIMELQYGDGWKEGQGYMEVWIGGAVQVGGGTAVRESFTVSGGSRKVDQVSIRLRQNATVTGAGDLGVRLEQADGTLLEQGSIPRASVPTAYGWVTYRFTTPRILASGASYNLVLTAPAGTAYDVFPIRQGSSYGFSPNTYFADGLAQVNTGSGWTGWTMWGTTNNTDGDLQFWFRVVQ